MKYNEEDTILENGKNNTNDESTVIANDVHTSNDEGTVVDEVKTKDSTGSVSSPEAGEKSEPIQSKGVNWKQVAITTSSAAVMGAAGVLLTSFANAEVDIKEEGKNDDPKVGHHNNTTNHPETTHSSESAHTSESEQTTETAENVAEVRVEGLPVSHNVTDDMSFEEAFTAARQEVGPGGVFEWHGGVYGTYYASEWNAMSDEEHQEFGNHISYRDNSMGEEIETNDTPKEELAEVKVETEAEIVDAEVVDIEVEDPSNVEVELLGHDLVTLEDGSQMEMGFMEVEGHSAIVVDVDVDGSYDILGVDFNDNGQMESNEIVDIQGAGLTVQGFDDQMSAGNDLYAELPDYTNDADPSSFT